MVGSNDLPVIIQSLHLTKYFSHNILWTALGSNAKVPARFLKPNRRQRDVYWIWCVWRPLWFWRLVWLLDRCQHLRELLAFYDRNPLCGLHWRHCLWMSHYCVVKDQVIRNVQLIVRITTTYGCQNLLHFDSKFLAHFTDNCWVNTVTSTAILTTLWE